MNKTTEALLLGKCPDCTGGTLHHGPWSHAQIAEAAEDIGMPPEDFVDTCDGCFVQHVCHGDTKYAAELMGRPPQM